MIKLIVFDLDDTLIYGESNEMVGLNPVKFSPVGYFDSKSGPNMVVDGPNRVQVLVPHVREVLSHLNELEITMTLGSMGPEWQIRRFLQAFHIDHYFDFEIGSYDRRDKGEKVELCIDHYNNRLLTQFSDDSDVLHEKLVQNHETLFVDDNLGYLGRVDNYLPGIKVLFAHYHSEQGMLDFYRDLKEEHEIDLFPDQKSS